tara:strand:- start:1313 stop:1708 length:396 start_codon:yes stop_codon:yes gene_type:complete
MSKFKRERHNPIDLMKQWWPDVDISHITYDPSMKPSERQYWRMGNSASDGTKIFTIEMLQKSLLPLLNGTSTYRPEEPKDWSTVKGINYTIGNISHAIVYGMIYLDCSKTQKYSGQRERVRIPVRCEYVYK